MVRWISLRLSSASVGPHLARWPGQLGSGSVAAASAPGCGHHLPAVTALLAVFPGAKANPSLAAALDLLAATKPADLETVRNGDRTPQIVRTPLVFRVHR